MATVQKAIAESSSYTTRTLTTTISAPGIRQDAEISVSPNIDASKVSYVIDEVAETIKVTLTNANYTGHETHYSTETYTGSSITTNPDGSITVRCQYTRGKVLIINPPAGSSGSCPATASMANTLYYFNYTVTVSYKTFPEFAAKVGNQKRRSVDGWARVGGQLKQIQKMWVRANGQLREV